MAKKDNTKKVDKKVKKEQLQSVNEEKITSTVNEKTENKIVSEKEEIKEETPVVIEVVDKRGIESIEIPITLEGTAEVLEETKIEDKQPEKEENVKKKQITTSEMFGYNWMGQIYDY